MLKRIFSIIFDVLTSWYHVLFIFRFRTLLTWIFWSGSAKVLHQGTTIGNVDIVRLVIVPTTGTVVMCDALCVLCFAVGMFCVRVGHVVVTRQTDWLSLFFCLNRMVRYRLDTTGPQVMCWIFPTQRLFSVWVWGWVSSVEFTCGRSMEIIWLYQGDVISKSRAWHWIR